MKLCYAFRMAYTVIFGEMIINNFGNANTESKLVLIDAYRYKILIKTKPEQNPIS